ncbi:DUF2818 family protein [Ideonella sp. A 288]|uniref:DUF2818 family protein n=1 Tax=Ideonella sp. A 288 TaxID=1962181 RepID=UPI000B4B9A96|nr:DUF2818 family protein [Ideonella sp. A 288]
MSGAASVWLLLAVGVVAANLPFFTERLLLVGPRRPDKGIGWRLIELLLLAALTIGLGMLVEARGGQRHPQAWPFYAAAGCLFITFAFPGFVWRHLRRQPVPRHG